MQLVVISQFLEDTLSKHEDNKANKGYL